MGFWDFLKRKKEEEPTKEELRVREEPTKEEEELPELWISETEKIQVPKEYIRGEEPTREPTIEEPVVEPSREEVERREQSRKRIEKLKRQREELERAKRRKEEGLKVEREMTLAERRATLRRAGETRWQRFERGAKAVKTVAKGVGEVAGVGYKLGTLGGPIKGAKAMVTPKAMYKGLYVPPTPRPESFMEMRGLAEPGTAMRSLTAPEYAPLRETTIPRIGGLRQPPSIRTMGATPLTGMATSDPTFERLRKLTIPRGLTRVEKEAWSEVVRNGDVDTPSHIIGELSQLGISRRDAEKAIRGLLKKGVVRKAEMVGKERVLEIAR